MVKSSSSFHVTASTLEGRMRPEKDLVDLNYFTVGVVQRFKLVALDYATGHFEIDFSTALAKT